MTQLTNARTEDRRRCTLESVEQLIGEITHGNQQRQRRRKKHVSRPAGARTVANSGVFMELKYVPKWQQRYEALLLEFDPRKIAALVEAVETAMFSRQRELSIIPDGHDEKLAIADAAASLLVIKREILGFPGLEFIDQKEVQADSEPD
jgi:hypothetical protein